MSAQDAFIFTSNKKKVAIPFELVNNLIIFPIEVNGIKLNFLLDTGVEETILFSLRENDEVQLYNTERIMLRGLGTQDAVEGLKSKKNTLSLHGLECKNQEILVILDETFNFSSSLGVVVNGIIGYHFFENNFVKIDYIRKKLYVYNPRKLDKEKIINGYKSYPITIEKCKPYISSEVGMNEQPIPAKLLLDTGNSDAVWLFQNRSSAIAVPEKNFEDFLGRGFSGDIFGKKARIYNFAISNFEFEKPLVAFPDTLSIKNVKMVDKRLGSIGGEIFRRFSVVFDYKEKQLYLRKNKDFDDPFHYNMSGIVLHHAGLQWVQAERIDNNSSANTVKIDFGSAPLEMKYKFELKPVYEIVSVRKNSPADKIGLKSGDVLIAINGVQSYKYSLQDINEILKSEAGRNIVLEVDRKSTVIKYKFRLENIL
ncbi:PDZ domain-containing protein [Flavobacterium sp. 3HN19-14]|uniref:PDZ domain-containing protein n=1 Tax=Flavobacterium sp. 3HN19-14 TaxID=3448133 RepID=UPI003EE3CFAB